MMLNTIYPLKFLAAVFTVVLLFSPLSAYVEDRETEYLLNRHVEAMGGRGAIQEISTISMRGLTKGESGEERSIFLVRKSPDKVRLNLTSNDTELVVGFDGSEVWYYYNKEGRIVVPKERVEEFESIRRDSFFWLPITQYEKAEYKITQLPDETIDGIKCYVFQAEIAETGTERYFIDQTTLLPIRRVVDEVSEDGVIEETVTIYGDYEVIGGAQFPMSMKTIGKDGTSVQIKFDRIRINKGIFDSYFKKP